MTWKDDAQLAVLPLSQPLDQIVRSMVERKVLVVGDIMLDRYLIGSASRISPEAPVPVVAVEYETLIPGGAANVACNIAALGGRPYILGVIGGDREGHQLLNLLSEKGVNVDAVVVASDRPTSVKTRVVASGQQIVRVDNEKVGNLSEDLMAEMRKSAGRMMDSMDGAVLSDYAKGVLEPGIIRAVLDASSTRGKPTVVDPKESHYSSYRDATIVTPNHHEAGRALNRKVTDEISLREIGTELLHLMGSRNLLVTCGDKGMALFGNHGDVIRIPTVAREVFDVTGAGDTVVATLILALAGGASLRDASILANMAAGIKVGKHGTATVSPEELIQTRK